MDEKMKRGSMRGRFARGGRSWQLWLLGATSVVLSVASGWTTWDGMRNFTEGNILSLLITFGIQGVLLVLAWFVGARLAEGFAVSDRFGGSPSEGRGLNRILGFVEAIIVVGLVLLLANLFAVNFAELPPAFVNGLREYAVNDVLIWGAGALLVILVVVRSGRAFIGGSVLTAQIIVRQAIPVAMLTTCLLASVFFSFDSLFSNILPDDERRRIADLRSKTVTAGIISEISDKTTRTYLDELETVMSGPAWQAYKGRLDELGKVLKQVPAQAGAYLTDQERGRLAQSNQRQSERLKLENEKRIVDQRRQRAAAELAQRQDRSKAIRAEIASLSKRIDENERAILIKLAQMDAEEKGIGETAQAGRGPVYRGLAGELERLRAQKGNLELSRDNFQKQLAQNDARVARSNRRQLTLDDERRQLEMSSKLVGAATPEDAKLDEAARLREAAPQLIGKLAAAQQAFERSPDRETLGALATQCAEAAGATKGAPFAVTPFDPDQCSAAGVQAAAARVFVLERGQRALAERCVGNDTAVQAGGLEAQLAYARNCMKMSELLPVETAAIVRRINGLERERDDKAHRFVITSNAFLDGNKLAYLALAIALAIDGLILASGILGALTMRSPLAVVRRPAAYSVADCEALIESALLPDVAYNARKMLEIITPTVTKDTRLEPGWTHTMTTNNVARHAPRTNLKRLLNSGMAIGAVEAVSGRPGEYTVHSGMVAYLANLARTPSRQDAEQERLSALADMCIKVLGPGVAAKAERILRYVQVSSEVDGYSSAVRLADVAPEDRETVRRCFNAAAAFDCVRRVGDDDDNATILLRPMLYSLLVEFALEPGDADAKDKPEALRYGPTGLLETSGPPRVVTETKIEDRVEAAAADQQPRAVGTAESGAPETVPVTTRR